MESYTEGSVVNQKVDGGASPTLILDGKGEVHVWVCVQGTRLALPLYRLLCLT